MDRPSENSRNSKARSRSSQRWEIESLAVNLPRQTRVLDCIRMKACLAPKEGRPQRVEKIVSAINRELRKMQELLASSDSLEDNIIDGQMKAYVQEVNKSYRQAIKYNGYIGSQGRSAREQGEVKLKELLSTTVVTKRNKRDDVCSDSAEQQLDGCAEKRTKQGESERKEAWKRPDRRKVAESRVQ